MTQGVDKGTLIRSLLLFIALVNQIFGVGTIALDEGEVITLVDGTYLLVSTLFTVIMSIVAWFKNNYVTIKGQRQRKVLQREGLAKK